MNQFVSKINLGAYEINGPFVHQHEDLGILENYAQPNRWKERMDWNIPNEFIDYCFVEYIIIKFENEIDNDLMRLVIQCQGFDLWDRQNYIHYNKVLPFQTENLFDIETNKLLYDMARNEDDRELNKILFVYCI